jgi:hypothetical protein
MRRITALILIPLALAACANPGLRDIRSNSAGPDEFIINPVKELAAPSDYTNLPKPTRGEGNLTDRSARGEGTTAVGGRVEDPNAPVPRSDGALVQHASRLGVQGDIRENLAEADAKFRKRKQRLTQIRLVPIDRYNQAYKRQALDAPAEQKRWRRAGVATPSSPPN